MKRSHRREETDQEGSTSFTKGEVNIRRSREDPPIWALSKEALALSRAAMQCDTWPAHGHATTTVIAACGQPLPVCFLNSALIGNFKIISHVLIRTFLAMWLLSYWVPLWKLSAGLYFIILLNDLLPKRWRGKKNSVLYKWAISNVLVFQEWWERGRCERNT